MGLAVPSSPNNHHAMSDYKTGRHGIVVNFIPAAGTSGSTAPCPRLLPSLEV